MEGAAKDTLPSPAYKGGVERSGEVSSFFLSEPPADESSCRPQMSLRNATTKRGATLVAKMLGSSLMK